MRPLIDYHRLMHYCQKQRSEMHKKKISIRNYNDQTIYVISFYDELVAE